MGLEWDRLIYPIKTYHPQKIIIIQQEENLIKDKQYSDIIKKSKELSESLIKKTKFLVDSEVISVNYHDYENCLFTLKKVIESNCKNFDEISINVSTGSKILVLAAVVVSQFFNCKLIYVVPKQYSIFDSKMKVNSKGVLSITEIKPFNLNPLINLKKMEYKILFNLDNNNMSLSDLTQKIFSKKINDYEIIKKKNLILYHIKTLNEKNLIKIINLNNQKYMCLTELGKFLKEIKKCDFNE